MFSKLVNKDSNLVNLSKLVETWVISDQNPRPSTVFGGKGDMILIFWLNDSCSCQQFLLHFQAELQSSAQPTRSSVTRERDEKRSARSWNLRVISRTQQSVKIDNRSSHNLSHTAHAHTLNQ